MFLWVMSYPAGKNGHAVWNNLSRRRHNPYTVVIRAEGVDCGSATLTRSVRLGEAYMSFKSIYTNWLEITLQ